MGGPDGIGPECDRSSPERSGPAAGRGETAGRLPPIVSEMSRIERKLVVVALAVGRQGVEPSGDGVLEVRPVLGDTRLQSAEGATAESDEQCYR